jgi:ribonuclease HII
LAGAPYRFERAAWRRGIVRVAGVDEAGRGPLAGPVVAAAVVLPPGGRIAGVDDSKRLVPEERERLFEVIQAGAMAVGIAVVDHLTIDRINILEATRLAMGQALAALEVEPELVLTDYVTVPGLGCPQRNLVDGDRRSASVAAASIIAKVTRDRIMQEADREYPVYGFGRHKGYPTPEHRLALELHGPCALHRRTFAGIWSQMTLFSRSELEWIEAD